MVELKFFVPASHLEKVKKAIFEAGAGRIGHYDCCSWQVLGQGQFRPLSGASPYLGELGDVTYVQEYRVELVCDDASLEGVICALKQAHPYEAPAYSATRLLDV
jgi:hypothetical protein